MSMQQMFPRSDGSSTGGSGAGPTWPTAYVFRDTMTGAAGLLDLHSPEVGSYTSTSGDGALTLDGAGYVSQPTGLSWSGVYTSVSLAMAVPLILEVGIYVLETTAGQETAIIAGLDDNYRQRFGVFDGSVYINLPNGLQATTAAVIGATHTAKWKLDKTTSKVIIELDGAEVYNGAPTGYDLVTTHSFGFYVHRYNSGNQIKVDFVNVYRD